MENIKREVRFKLDDKLHDYILEESKKKKISLAEYMRDLVWKDRQAALGYETIDTYVPLVEQSMRNILNPFEKRIMKVVVKAVLFAAQALKMNENVLEKAGYDIRDLNQKARKESVALLQTEIKSLIEDKEES